MIEYAPDEIDLLILNSLRENATRSHKEIGQLVHLTGQAVGARVRRLEDAGIIEGYTVRVREERLGAPAQLALVTVFMHPTSSHQTFQRFLREDDRVEEAQRVSGEGCYWLRVRTQDHADLNRFLDDLLRFGNYRCSLSTARIK
ncbi:Lrp/AsnC family transcriptional regulator [Cohnella nanjingensis]|uniref:Lrp/AsnC family transcriptional regulator n=1 Tax=Cohnella nanjingensis TaxID=1387779 RepID=A0A7X0RT25_9BACL|nr:Lrp/AsnC family transcriptional regulator [Cohnella nanjingensis]MBB6671674.1 Lrp/AsnC family transcriptional regulator [Cohnella nanjingensis]